jgi:hypothetical protein
LELPHVHVVDLILEARIARGTVKLSDEHDDFVWAGRRELAKLELVPAFKPFFAALYPLRRPTKRRSENSVGVLSQ